MTKSLGSSEGELAFYWTNKDTKRKQEWHFYTLDLTLHLAMNGL